MKCLLRLLHLCRHSNRLILSVAAAFLLSAGVSMATPAIQANNLSPDQQLICLGSGGMKLVTFAADGTATESQVNQSHGSQCLLCTALQALPPARGVFIGLSVGASVAPSLTLVCTLSTFKCPTPPATGPPLIS